MASLSKKIAFIIGGSNGISRATAEILSNKGVAVHVIGNNPGKLEQVSQKLGVITDQV